MSVSPIRDGRSRAARRLPKRAVATVSAVTIAALALSACAGGSATKKKASSVATTLTIADTSFPASMDPGSGQNANNQYYDLAYDPLIVQKVDGGFAPGLATSWKYGAGNKSFSFVLRSGVKFSDGEKLDSSAVKTWVQHALKVPGGAAPNYLGALTTVDTPDATHVTLNFSKPTPQLPFVFSQALEMGMIGSPKAVAAKTLDTATAGAGEYVLDKSQTVNGDHYTFTPNKYYWNKKAIHWKKVVIKYITSPTTTLQAMKSGQVQFAVQQQVSSIGAAKAAGLNVTMPQQAFYGLSFNDRTGAIVPALAKVQVRQAINYALDRNAINKAVYDGYGKPTDQVALPGDDGYDASLNSKYPYNPTKAKALLAQAGYPNGFSMKILDVKALGFDTLAQAISGELAKVGVKATPVDASNIGDYFGKLASGKYETSILGFGGLPGYFLYGLLFGKGATQFNPLKTRSSELDSAYESILSLNANDAKKYAQQMVRFVTEQAWFAPLVSTPFTAFAAKGIAGSQARTDGRRLWYLPELYPAS